MVKDDRHRTRALVTADGREIGISGNQAVFALIGSIQEETHRSAITYQKKLRGEDLASQLDDIPGIGPKRRNMLLTKSLQMVIAAMKLKDTCSLEEKL